MSNLDFSTATAISGFSASGLSGLAAGGYTFLQSGPVAKPSLTTRLALRLVTGTPATLQAAGETLSLHVLEARDGTNFPNPPGNAAQAAPLTTFATQYPFTGAVTGTIDFPVVECPAFPFGFMLHNNSVNALPSGTWTIELYGFTETLS